MTTSLDKPPTSFLCISAPHFVAGAEVEREVVVLPAPIISYMHGWTVYHAMAYATSKRWVAVWSKP